MPRRFFDLLSHIIITVQVKDISDEVESVLIVLYIRVESSQVETVREIVLIDFAEVFVAPRRDKLQTDLSAGMRLHWL